MTPETDGHDQPRRRRPRDATATGACCASSAGSPTRSTACGRRSPSRRAARLARRRGDRPRRRRPRASCAGCNTDEEGNQAVATGTVTALDPPRLVEFATEPHGVPALRAARGRRRDGADVHRDDARAERADRAGALRLAHPPRAPRRRARRPPGRLAALGRGAPPALGRDPRGTTPDRRARSASAAGRARYGEWLPGSSIGLDPEALGRRPPRPRRADDPVLGRDEVRRGHVRERGRASTARSTASRPAGAAGRTRRARRPRSQSGVHRRPRATAKSRCQRAHRPLVGRREPGLVARHEDVALGLQLVDEARARLRDQRAEEDERPDRAARGDERDRVAGERVADDDDVASTSASASTTTAA